MFNERWTEEGFKPNSEESRSSSHNQPMETSQTKSIHILRLDGVGTGQNYSSKVTRGVKKEKEILESQGKFFKHSCWASKSDCAGKTCIAAPSTSGLNREHSKGDEILEPRVSRNPNEDYAIRQSTKSTKSMV